MRRLCVLALLLVPAAAFCQQNSADSQTLKALLEEVKQLRRDLKTTTVAGQRVQIALYRLQLQDAALARATRLADETHLKLATVTDERTHVAAQIEQFQKAREKAQDDHERASIDEALPQLKQRVEGLTADEEQWTSKANEADSQVRAEQLKLDELHTLLDQLDEALQNAGSPKAAPVK